MYLKTLKYLILMTEILVSTDLIGLWLTCSILIEIDKEESGKAIFYFKEKHFKGRLSLPSRGLQERASGVSGGQKESSCFARPEVVTQ